MCINFNGGTIIESFNELREKTRELSTREIVERMTEISNDPLTYQSHNGIKKFCMYYTICCNRLRIDPNIRLSQMAYIDKSVLEEGISEGWIKDGGI